MIKIKSYLLNVLYFITFLFAYLIIINLLSYISFFNYKNISILSFIYLIVLFILFGIKTSKNSLKRGYLSGFIVGVINILIMFILALITNSDISTKLITYYILLLVSSVFGGMIGINIKKK